MEYGKVVYNGKAFKVAICNYPGTVREDVCEYAVIKPGKKAYEEVTTFLAATDQEAKTKGIEIAKEHNLE